MASPADLTAQTIASLQQAQAQAAANLAQLELAGPQAWVDYSADGESYQYAAAKRQLLASITEYQQTIAKLSQPWFNRSQGC